MRLNQNSPKENT
uniref:Uncharacterized protein n=1 Tax=Lepeophtheirus salmonis TaxID=72036 RepID=A0A0K2UGR4_LEPSM